MKKISVFYALLCITTALSAFNPVDWEKKISWYGQDSLVFQADQVIAVDPLKAPPGLKADIILITHSHGDHLNPAVVSALTKESTIILAPQDCLAKLGPQARLMVPGQKETFGTAIVEGVPAYNIKKSFHKKSSGWLGYIITLDDTRFYVAGDTERIPEMAEWKVDVAFLPLGQTYTMGSPEEAAEAALDVKAQWAVPIHWGQYEGKESDVQKFKEALKGKVNVLSLTRL